jgi:hypothetical protein
MINEVIGGFCMFSGHILTFSLILLRYLVSIRHQERPRPHRRQNGRGDGENCRSRTKA